jgi:hypothetical protein
MAGKASMTETVSAKSTRFFIFYIPPIEGATGSASCTPGGVSYIRMAKLEMLAAV